jgi:hypothetical protein
MVYFNKKSTIIPTGAGSFGDTTDRPQVPTTVRCKAANAPGIMNLKALKNLLSPANFRPQVFFPANTLTANYPVDVSGEKSQKIVA